MALTYSDPDNRWIVQPDEKNNTWIVDPQTRVELLSIWIRLVEVNRSRTMPKLAGVRVYVLSSHMQSGDRL